MIAFSLKELVQKSKGLLHFGAKSKLNSDEALIKSVSTSSKSADQDTLFIPLKGERFDAHDFIEDALDHGAGAVGSHRSYDELKGQVSLEKLERCTVVECSDTLRLLGLCGQIVRHKSGTLIGAITGSCGKTTVKEMSASILAQKGKTLFTEGNFNNDVGVPLTLLRLDNSFEYAIVEQGASHLEDIARTSEFVEADFALITNVGEAHIEGFGSSKGVYQGKSEILDKLFSLYPVEQKDYTSTGLLKGIAIVPADNKFIDCWKEDYSSAFAQGKLLTFGTSSSATMQVSNIVSTNNVLSFHLHSNDERFKCDVDITINSLGRHNAINAAGAALLAMAMGASEQEVVQGLSTTENMKGRLTPISYDHGLTIIDDAYNASFNAVIAAIDTLEAFEGNRVFIFGDMGELGTQEVELHQKVGAYAKDKIDLLLCIGPLSQYSVSAMGHKSLHFTKHEDLIDYLENYLTKNLQDQHKVTCLIKGSHAMHMDIVVNALKDFANQKA